jgi:hypothetical protein
MPDFGSCLAPPFHSICLFCRRPAWLNAEFQGTSHIYRLDRRGFDELRQYLDNFEGIPGFPKAPDGLFLS